MNRSTRKLITYNLSLPTSTWSVGVNGAIAEFMRSEEECVTKAMLDGLAITTPRGAIKISPIESVQQIRHKNAVHFCVSDEQARLPTNHQVVTEMHADSECVSGEFKQDILFDLGLAMGHRRACVRTGDTELLSALRANVGGPLLGAGPDLLHLLVATSPHRVFFSVLARIEVYGPIPTQTTPNGPHTHLLPALLGTRDGPLDQLIPASHSICLSLYPSH